MVEIKPFDEKYIVAVKDILAQVCLNEYKCHQQGNSIYLQDWKNWVYEQNFEYYKFYPKHMLMAFDGPRLVGFSSIKRLNGGMAEIKKIFLLPEYRNLNIGQRLYFEIMKNVPELGEITNVQAIVCVLFFEAINFFEKNGFKITAIDPKKMEYRMERSIDSIH